MSRDIDIYGDTKPHEWVLDDNRAVPIDQCVAVHGHVRIAAKEVDCAGVRRAGTDITAEDVLGGLDDKIDLNQRMNKTLEATARAIFNDWFTDFGPTRAKAEGRSAYLAPALWALFPDDFDDKEMPLGWKQGTIGEECDLTMGQSPPGETYNEEATGLPFYQGRTDFGFRYPTRRMFCTAPARIAGADDTLVSVRAPVGDLNMAWEQCCIGRGVAAVRHKSGSRSFTYYALGSLEGTLREYEHTGTVLLAPV
jgi:type I restriction enzyme S subunit